jgi:hypothetical protein
MRTLVELVSNDSDKGCSSTGTSFEPLSILADFKTCSNQQQRVSRGEKVLFRNVCANLEIESPRRNPCQVLEMQSPPTAASARAKSSFGMPSTISGTLPKSMDSMATRTLGINKAPSEHLRHQTAFGTTLELRYAGRASDELGVTCDCT